MDPYRFSEVRRSPQQEVPLSVADAAALPQDVHAQHEAEDELVLLEQAARHVCVRGHGGVVDKVSQVFLQVRRFAGALYVGGEYLTTERESELVRGFAQKH